MYILREKTQNKIFPVYKLYLPIDSGLLGWKSKVHGPTFVRNKEKKSHVVAKNYQTVSLKEHLPYAEIQFDEKKPLETILATAKDAELGSTWAK